MARSYKRKNFKKFKAKQLFKQCQFCKEKSKPNYKEVETLLKYIRKTGKITPRKLNANCAKHQRGLARAIKRARFLGLLPFV